MDRITKQARNVELAEGIGGDIVAWIPDSQKEGLRESAAGEALIRVSLEDDEALA